MALCGISNEFNYYRVTIVTISFWARELTYWPGYTFVTLFTIIDPFGSLFPPSGRGGRLVYSTLGLCGSWNPPPSLQYRCM